MMATDRCKVLNHVRGSAWHFYAQAWQKRDTSFTAIAVLTFASAQSDSRLKLNDVLDGSERTQALERAHKQVIF